MIRSKYKEELEEVTEEELLELEMFVVALTVFIKNFNNQKRR